MKCLFISILLSVFMLFNSLASAQLTCSDPSLSCTDENEDNCDPEDTCSPVVIDVLIVYTTAAKNDPLWGDGSNDLTEQRIQRLVDTFNIISAQSGVIHSMRLIHTEEVGYMEDQTSGIGEDIERLTNPTDQFPELIRTHELRDIYGADLVSLIVSNSLNQRGTGNLAGCESGFNPGRAFSVINIPGVQDKVYSFQHEIGHNLGLYHNELAVCNCCGESGEGPNYMYCGFMKGYVSPNGLGNDDNTTANTRFRTIMAYGSETAPNDGNCQTEDCEICPISCDRIPYWSNPDSTYLDTSIPYGNSTSNSVKGINISACLVSEYRTDGRTSDSLALVELYNSADGQSWIIEWNFLEPIDNWNGVLLNNKGRVVSLGVPANNLTGLITGLQLPFLDWINLYENNLYGTISDLSSRQFLSSVDLRNNKFTFEDILPNLAQNQGSISTFLYAPQQEVGEVQEVDIALEGDYTLCIDIDHDVTTNVYQWYKDGNIIPNANANPYTLEDLDYVDEGVYNCEITNPNASELTLVSKDITINVIEEVAPDIIWSYEYGGVDTSGIAYGICHSNDDNDYIICGSCSLNGSDNRYCIKKIDQLGEIIWQKNYGGTESDRAFSIIQSNDGQGYIIIGISTSNDGNVSGNNGLADSWLLAIDEDGEYLWDKNYGGSNHDMGLKIISQEDQTGYWLLGWTASSEIERYHDGKDYWVTKISNSGTEEWSKAFGGSLLDEPKDIILAVDGNGCVVVGYTKSDDGDLPNIPGNTTDAWYVKLSEDGDIDWQQSYNHPGSQLLASAITKNIDNDGYIISATAYGPYIDIPSPNSVVYSVFETTTAGDVNWIKYHPTYNSVNIYDICISNEQNGYIVGGNQHPFGEVWKVDIHGNWFWSRSSGQSCEAIIPNINEDGYVVVGVSPSPFDWWVFQLDGEAPLLVELSLFTGEVKEETNTLKWQTLSEENTDKFIVERSENGRDWESIGKVKAVGNSSVLQSYTLSDVAPLEKGYYRLRVLDNDGSKSYSDVIILERVSDESFAITQIFPNPTKQNISITYSHAKGSNLTYSVISMYGEELMNGDKLVSADEEQMELSLNNLPSGVYILMLQSGGEQVQQKFVKY